MITRDVQVGDLIKYKDQEPWEVKAVENGIAYESEHKASSTKCFIFKFANGEYNTMHTIVEG